MAGDASADARSLEFTPTWAVATVCTVFVVISLIIVKIIEKVEENLKHGKRKPLLQALDKMKEELMLLGFISLLLTVFQNYVASICVKSSVLEKFTPCHLSDKKKAYSETPPASESPPASDDTAHRRLLEYLADSLIGNELEPPVWRRELAAAAPSSCPAGKESFVSTTGLHQLHTFIFVLAVVHVVYSLIAMGLAMAKVRSWSAWELEAHSNTHDDLTEITKTLTMKRQSTFVTYHTSKPWSRNRFSVWIVCFFRQFGISVTRADYLTLRLGFIKNHNTGHKFNFHQYMIRCMEDEFKEIVGISAWLWAFVVAFLLFNVNGTNLYFWMCFIPVVLVIVVGTKLQHIIATLALENAMVKGPLPSIRPRDELFWFKTPTLLLKLIHFILFQNAFELATFIWFWWQFGFTSCLLENKTYVYIRIGLGVLTQILCSYSTLPLYALVTQMGSHYKHSIFQNDVKEKLHNWRKGAKKRAKLGTLSEESSYAGDDSRDGNSGAGSMTPEEGSVPHESRFDPRTGEQMAREAQMAREYSMQDEGLRHQRSQSESVVTQQVPGDIEMQQPGSEKKFLRTLSQSLLGSRQSDDSKLPYFKAFTVQVDNSPPDGRQGGSSYTPKGPAKEGIQFQPYI
ncbi:hypothetical protein AXG93_606s1190 [Marchantia polymorpha subsp. ruderalis]|uniref:MLO-like protein n=1 Tax=Marchantia polymorpha subsp. ruderalis TaxID=1480154 RepID=A0A176VKV5_MARPO|nr:hypothetical protein AXG93_606s1190 [Marchantia polymorpha subsp. ruderalis]